MMEMLYKTTPGQSARFRQSETGRAILAERRSLLARLSDRASLAALPPGSLGRAYYEFMATEDLSAEGLVEASKIRRAPTVDEITWFRERNREMHDLLHVTAGYGRDPLGEACVTAFSYAQTGLKGFAVIATVAAFRIARRLRGRHVLRAVYEAYRQGRRAAWVVGADWENLLSQPVDAVRARFRVSAPTYYPPQILGQPAARHRCRGRTKGRARGAVAGRARARAERLSRLSWRQCLLLPVLQRVPRLA